MIFFQMNISEFSASQQIPKLIVVIENIFSLQPLGRYLFAIVTLNRNLLRDSIAFTFLPPASEVAGR